MLDHLYFLPRTGFFWFVLLLLIALSYIGKMDIAEMVVAEKEYCTMVKQNIDTGGNYGWPDYKGTYETNCLNNIAGR